MRLTHPTLFSLSCVGVARFLESAYVDPDAAAKAEVRAARAAALAKQRALEAKR